MLGDNLEIAEAENLSEQWNQEEGEEERDEEPAADGFKRFSHSC